MRPFTKITLIVLVSLLAIAAIAQFTMGGPDIPYDGPIPGTPLPPVSATP